MSTVAKPQQTAKPAKSSQPKNDQTFLFDKENYMWMIAGVVLILIGFVLMSGGKSANPHEFHYEEIYSVRRITIAPIVLMIGFIVEAYAIMKKPKETQEEAQL
jgi:predicted tellurium resistance membrane protein TerC